MIDPSQLSGSVSTYDGVVSLPVELGAIDAAGMTESLALNYSSDVQEEATTWNLDAPTGVAGLGWSLGLSFIARQLSQSVAESESRIVMVVRGQRSPLVRTGTAADGALIYAPTVFLPWTIRFYENEERWVVSTEEGETFILGDRHSGRQTVGHRVVWGNWFGASGQTAGQRQTAAVWFLSERKSQFGQGFAFTYALTETAVGDAQGATFMQAAYLSRIVSTGGGALHMVYADKEPVEYVDPHTDPAAPNAYQSPYQTRYLQSVERYSRTGARVSAVELSYKDAGGQVALLGAGSLSKRLLTGLRRTYASGAARPATMFAYWGQDAADGVSAQTPYSDTTHALYGALKSVQTAAGGLARFDYAAVTPQYCDRQAIVAPPAATDTAPRVLMRDAFSAVTWLSADKTSFAVQAYTWEGRWIPAELGTAPCADAAAYAAAPLAASQTVLAAFSTPQLHLWRPAPGRPGAWVAPQVDQGETTVDYYTPDLVAGEAALLEAGRDFAGLLGLTSGKLFLYRFNGQAWDAQAPVTIGAATQLLSMSANQSALIVASLATASPAAPIVLDIFTNANGAVSRHTLQVATAQTGSTQITLTQGVGFAVIRVDSRVGARTISDYAVVQWAQDFGSLTATWFQGLEASSTPVIAESTIAIGRTLITYDGRTWSAFDTDTISYPGQVSVEAFQAGAGVCVRKIKTSVSSAEAYVYDLLNFDPNTGRWATPTGLKIDAASGDGALAVAQPNGPPSLYAVLNNTLFHRQPDGAWASAGALSPVSAADAASLVLEHDFAAYQTHSGDASVATQIVPLQNGQSGTADPLAEAQVSVPGQPAAYLIGRNAVLSYAGDFTATPGAVTLSQLVRGAVTGQQTVYAAVKLSLDSGYQTEILAQTYSPEYAVAQTGGWTGAYQKVASLTGGDTLAAAALGPSIELYFNGLTASESAGLDYPAGAGANTAIYYGYVRGLSYKVLSYSRASPDTNPVAEAVSWWAVTTAPVGGGAQSAYGRQIQASTTRDGATRTTVYQYGAHGFVSTLQTERYDADNHRILTTQTYTRWPEIYDPNGDNPAPLTAPVVKTVSASQDTTAGGDAVVYEIQITTWSDQWAAQPGAWAPFKTFAALSAEPGAFDHWTSTAPFTPDANDWRQTSVVLSRTPTGLPVETSDVLETLTSYLYDTSDQLITAVAQNVGVSAGDVSYLGFEPYEAPGPWRWAPSGTLDSHIVSSDRNTGERCLAIPYSSDGATGPFAPFYPHEQSGAYVFGCWARLSAAAGSGAATWTLQVYKQSDHSAVGAALTLDMTTAGVNWTLFQSCVDLAKIRQTAGLDDTIVLYLVVSAGSTLQNVTCLVDDLRFAPLDARLAAGVYDPDTLLETATLDSNGQVGRTLYDSYDQAFAAIGAGERVDQAQLISFSRQLASADAFVPDFGNTTAQLTSLTGSYYDDFFSSQAGDWIFAPAADWAVESGRLGYSGGAGAGLGGTATYARQAHTNMAASIEIVSRDAAADIAIGNGDLFVRWNAAETRWELVRLSGATVTVEAVNTTVGLQRRLSIVIVDGFAMAFADGAQIFAYRYSYPDPAPPNYGKCTITATGPSTFDNLVVFDDPSLAVATSDGMGRELQQLGLVGYKATGPAAGDYPAQSHGVFLDGAGRASVVRNASQGPLAIAPSATPVAEDGTPAASLLVAAPEDNLYSSEGEALSLAQYLDGYEGYYDYLAQTFEDSALSRPVRLSPPRSGSAAAADYDITLTYGAAASLPGGSSQADDPAHYFVTSASRLFAIDASDTRITVTQTRYADFDGRPLFEQTQTSDGGASRKEAFVYDAAGRLSMVKQPNAFDPPGGSDAAVWRRTWDYTFQGWVEQTTDPDSGAVKFLYDRAGRLRFKMGAAGAGLSPQQIVYRKYDALSRVIETGVVQDASYDFNALAAKVDEEDFPQIVQAGASGPLQAVGQWTYRYDFDRTAADDIANLIGRLWRVRINNGDAANPDSEAYAYDIQGNTIQVTTAAESYAPGDTQVLGYAYNNRDLVAKITYPEPLSGRQTPFEAGYVYDRLGRLSSVGLPVPDGSVVDPNNPPTPPESAFALYDYDTDGRLAALQLNNLPDLDHPQPPIQRQFDYDEFGRLSLVADRYSSDHFDYDTAGGVGGVRYFTGLIAGVRRENQAGALWPCPPDAAQTVTYAYDGLGRLTASQSDLGWPYRLVAGPGGYDANGNALSRTRGAARQDFVFRTEGGKRIDNQVARTDAQADAAASIDFEAAAAAAHASGPWSWGANNGGASGSRISTDNPHSGSQCLYLAGGGLNHREGLRLSAYLDPRGVYTLNGFVRTDTGFDQADGLAYWRLQVSGPGGSLLDRQIAGVASAADWTAFGPVTIDLADAIATLGGAGDTVTVVIELVNAKRGADGATGPGLYIDDITVTGQVTGAEYGYDADGRVTSAPARGLHQLGYEPVLDRTNLIQLVDAAGDKLVYGFDSGGERLVERRTNAGGASTQSTQLSLSGLGSKPLFVKTKTGETETRLFRVLGLDGLIACSDGGDWSYILSDWLGSTDQVFDTHSAVSASVDYLPFGPLAVTSGDPDTQTLYGGQALDPQTGLYDFHARLYDPELGRFYATDPADQYASPYLYAGNDPINQVDPSGRSAIAAIGTVAAIAPVIYGVGLRRSLKWGAATAALSVAAGYLGAQFAATEAWDDWGFHGAFSSVFDDKTVKYMMQENKSGGLLSLPVVDKLAITLGRVLFNFSRQEFKAISGVYPYTGPFMTPLILVKVYRGVQEDISHNWGPDGWGNAARHFFWMARAERFGGRALSNAIADAHEEGRPGGDGLGFYDNIADKINNVLGQHYAAEYPARDLQGIYDELRDGGLLALSGEGSAAFKPDATDQARAGVHQTLIQPSFARALAHIESRFQTQPHFEQQEREYLCKVIGWKCPD